MTTIVEKIGGNTRIVHRILQKQNDPKSYASAIQLRNLYQQNDYDFIRLKDWRYYFIVRRHFLRKKKKENGGVWICHYCKKEMTLLQIRGKSRQQKFKAVTVDHKTPLDRGGDKLSTANMLECCFKCNQKKGNTPYEKYVMGLN